LAVVRYAGCGGGVAMDSSISNGSVSSEDGAWSAAIGATTTESAGAGCPQQRSHRQHALDLGYNLVK
nr:hypothetical protein [Tanacetum cinerariifolium]